MKPDLLQPTRMFDKLHAYVGSGNRRVDGWLQPGAIEMICRINRAQMENEIDGHIAEIGIHHGRLFILDAFGKKK